MWRRAAVALNGMVGSGSEQGCHPILMLLDYHLRAGGAGQVARRADEFGISMAWTTGDHAVVEIYSDTFLLMPFHIDRVSKLRTAVRSSARRVIRPPRQAAMAAS